MKDIFGQALYSYWKGDHKTPYIVRRDDDYTDICSLKEYFSKKLYPTEKVVSKFVHGKILDIGCGAGRHVMHYQKRGFDITGIDNSPLAIKVCRERGCKKVKIMDVFDMDFAAQSFDTLLLYGHNIGICGTLAGVKRLFKSLRKYIKPKGVLLITTVSVTKTKKISHKKYNKKNQAEGRYIGHRRIRVEYKDQVGGWFNWPHVQPKELKEIAEQTGWTVEEIFEVDGKEYSAILAAC